MSNGKLIVPKKTMLFILNAIFDMGVSKNLTKEELVKEYKNIYLEKNYEDIIMMLPYDAYIIIEELTNYIKENENIEAFCKKHVTEKISFLFECMIIEVRKENNKYLYNVNKEILNSLLGLFTDEYKETAKKYDKLEKIVLGILYSYGAIESKAFKNLIFKYMNEIFSDKFLKELFFKRLSLNTMVLEYPVKWQDKTKEIYFTYLSNEKMISKVVTKQKSMGLKYKKFTLEEILNREEYYFDDRTKELYDIMKDCLPKQYASLDAFKTMIKLKELGDNDIIPEVSLLCDFKNEFEMERFHCVSEKWHDNYPEYGLCGYSLNEFIKCCT